MAKIGVVVTVVNEEIGVLARALDSVKSLADEILIVDMTRPGSGVTKIAEKYKARIVRHPFVFYVEPVRNFGIAKAESEWLLILDPDEEVPASLAEKLRRIAAKPQAAYFRIPRKNIAFGKWIEHSRWWPDYNIRFFKKGNVSWDEEIHAVPKTTGKGADLLLDEKYALIHHHYDSIEQYLERMNRYTSVQADLKIHYGYKFSWQDLIKKPFGELLSRYFAGEGYKDGIHGIALAGLQALSEFTVYLKVWQKEKFKQEKINLAEVEGIIDEEQRNINYWKADALFRQSGKFVHKLKRRFKL